MTSEWLLVEWCEEKKYSVVSRDKIVVQSERGYTDVDLIGKDIDVYWGRSRKKKYLATVLQCGSRLDMDFELEQIFNDTREIKEAHTSSLLANQIQNVLGEIPENLAIQLAEEQDENWKFKYEEMRVKADKYKNKVKTLKRKLKEFEGEEEIVQLSQGVAIQKSQLDTVKIISTTPSMFARNLMRCIFKNEELIGHSLFGRPCNANPNGITKSSVDPAKRDAVILYTLTEFRGNTQCNNFFRPKQNSILSQIHTSLGDMLRELTRKATAVTPSN